MTQIEQQLHYIQEMDLLKSVKRKALIKSDNNRYENSAEHSWHIAMAAQVLHQYALGNVDLLKVTQMLLIHDIVEIDAGDTFAFAAQSELDGQAEKEELAAKRIFGLLPNEQAEYYLALFHEFEASVTPEAQFAKGIDRILPLVQNMQNNGGSWAQNNVHKSQVLARNAGLANIAPELWLFAKDQIELATKNGWLRDH